MIKKIIDLEKASPERVKKKTVHVNTEYATYEYLIRWQCTTEDKK